MVWNTLGSEIEPTTHLFPGQDHTVELLYGTLGMYSNDSCLCMDAGPVFICMMSVLLQSRFKLVNNANDTP